jgi:signal recognition particle receptor subunit beta
MSIEYTSTQFLVTAAALILVTLIIFFRFVRTGRSIGYLANPEVDLLMGPSGSGKTSLFFSWELKDGKLAKTVTSQTTNRSRFGGSLQRDIVDCPGHPRLRPMGSKMVPRANRIVFLIDGADKESMRSAAEYLYDIFTAKKLQPKTRMLVCRNKTDSKQCVSQENMVATINSEIEKLRHSRAQELEGDNAIDQYIGVDGEEFDILKHSPIEVVVGSASVKLRQIQEIERFLVHNPFSK